MWRILLVGLLSVMGIFSHGHLYEEEAVQAIQGSWLQIYSNHYVQTTSEIDYQCVRAEVSPVRNTNSTASTISLTKKAYQHGNLLLPVEWTQTYTVLFQNNEWDTLEDNLVLQPSTKSSSVVLVPLWLRRMSPQNYILWSGLDNKTMLVWSHSMLDAVNNGLILQQLEELDFNGSYKSPLVSYSLMCF